MRAAILIAFIGLTCCTSCASKKSERTAARSDDQQPSASNSAQPAKAPPAATTPARPRTAELAGGAAAPRRTGLPTHRAVDAALDRPVVEAQFTDLPLSDCLAWLAERIHTPIRVDWAALEAAGADRKALVSLHAKEESRREVLEILLQHYTNGIDADYAVLDGVVLVSTHDALAELPLVRTYDVSDLLAADRMLLGRSGDVPAGEVDALAAERLLWVIEAMIEPGTWDAGADEASAAVCGSTLSVRAPSFAQREIGDLLATLRRAQLTTPHTPEWVGRAPADPEDEAKLNDPIAAVEFQSVPFETAIDWLRPFLPSLAIMPDWDALEQIGIRRDAVVDLAARGVSIPEVLELCAQQLTPKYEQLAYRAADGELLITTIAELDESPAVRIYDVRPILDDAAWQRSETRSRFAGAATTQPSTLSTGDDHSPAPLTQDEVALLRSLTFMVLPDWWMPAENGASAECFAGYVLVRGEPGLQERVAQYLAKLAPTTRP